MTDESGAGGTGCCGNNIDLEVHAGPPRISPDEAISNLAGAGTKKFYFCDGFLLICVLKLIPYLFCFSLFLH